MDYLKIDLEVAKSVQEQKSGFIKKNRKQARFSHKKYA
jgi:hypothetical protein